MRTVLVRKGTKYGQEYTRTLQKMIGNVFVLTDQEEENPHRRLNHDLPGWWSKLELFSPENEDLRPLLYIDLDSYVLGDISFIREPTRFLILREWVEGVGRVQSSFMLLPKDTREIWDEFQKQKRNILDHPGGDQWFLGRFQCEFIQDLYPGLVGSYKLHNREKPVNTIITFHGRPKCHQADGWAKDVWLTYNPPNS